VRRGDHGGQSPHPTMRAQKQFSKTAVFVFTFWASPSSSKNQQSVSFSCSRRMNESEFYDSFVSQCLFTQGCYHNSISRHFAPNTKLSQMQNIFMHFVWVFSTPYFTVCTINVSIQEQPCFISKQQTVKQIKSFTHITKKSTAMLNSCIFLRT